VTRGQSFQTGSPKANLHGTLATAPLEHLYAAPVLLQLLEPRSISVAIWAEMGRREEPYER